MIITGLKLITGRSTTSCERVIQSGLSRRYCLKGGSVEMQGEREWYKLQLVESKQQRASEFEEEKRVHKCSVTSRTGNRCESDSLRKPRENKVKGKKIK